MHEYMLVKNAYDYEGSLDLMQGLKFSFSKIHIPCAYVYDKHLQKQIITKMVKRKYEKLLKMLTFYLNTDDDTGTAYQEALTEIERFRMLIKNKYRAYVLETQLKEMSKTLMMMQRKANRKLTILQRKSLYSYQQEHGRGGKG